jgi:hypothetical protein
MKHFFSFLLTLISLTISCQEDHYEVAKKEFENFIFSSDSIKIQNIKNEKFENISEIFRYNQIVSRELDFGLKEIIFNIEYSYIFKSSFRYSRAIIHFFYYKNKIVDRLIIYEGKELKIANKFDSEINKYINSHNSFYNTKTTIKDFLTDILKSEIYGDGCGFAMIKVKEIDGINLNSLENAEKYVEWMKSYSPEKQMWGYSEIDKLLKKNLIELESEESKIYNHIKDRNAILETFSGCTFGIFRKVFK